MKCATVVKQQLLGGQASACSNKDVARLMNQWFVRALLKRVNLRDAVVLESF